MNILSSALHLFTNNAQRKGCLPVLESYVLALRAESNEFTVAENIRLGCKWLSVSNTPVYYSTYLIIHIKSLIVHSRLSESFACHDFLYMTILERQLRTRTFIHNASFLRPLNEKQQSSLFCKNLKKCFWKIDFTIKHFMAVTIMYHY